MSVSSALGCMGDFVQASRVFSWRESLRRGEAGWRCSCMLWCSRASDGAYSKYHGHGVPNRSVINHEMATLALLIMMMVRADRGGNGGAVVCCAAT